MNAEEEQEIKGIVEQLKDRINMTSQLKASTKLTQWNGAISTCALPLMTYNT